MRNSNKNTSKEKVKKLGDYIIGSHTIEINKFIR